MSRLSKSSEIRFRMDRFSHLLLLNAYYKEGSTKSQAILMAFRSCILTGKPELLLYLMCFFSGFLKSIVVFAPSLCTRR